MARWSDFFVNATVLNGRCLFVEPSGLIWQATERDGAIVGPYSSDAKVNRTAGAKLCKRTGKVEAFDTMRSVPVKKRLVPIGSRFMG